MKIFVEIVTHDFMDLKPSTEVNYVEENCVERLVNNIKRNWSGGTVISYKKLTKEEAVAFVDNLEKKEKANWNSDSQEVIDRARDILNMCYK